MQLENETTEMEQDPDKYVKEAPVAFVTFKHTSVKNKVLIGHRHTFLKRKRVNYYDGQAKYKIKITQAHPPDEIKWENLHVTTQTLRSAFTWFITALIIAGSFVGNYYLKKNGDKYAIKWANTADSHSIKVKIYSLLSSICIAIINMIVIVVIPILTRLENT